MFGKQKRYITIPADQASESSSHKVSLGDVQAHASLKHAWVGLSGTSRGKAKRTTCEDVQIIYRIDTIVNASRGIVCVVGFGNAMKLAVKAAVQTHGGEVWVTGTEDKRRGFSCSNTAQVIGIGTTFDERLFSNEYAIMQAASGCGAGVLLVVNKQAAQSKLLQLLAYREGIAMFAPYEDDKTYQLWVSLEPSTEEAAAFERYHVEWDKCPVCKLYHLKEEVLADHGTCPTCGGLYRLTSDERIAETFDTGSFEEWDTDITETDPLGFPDYPALLESMRSKSNLEEAVRCGCARLAGMPVAFCIMESTFMMGSMGSVVGEKITRTVERATAQNLPVLIFTASGGARMQEGLVSLMQMAKISAAIERHGKAGLPYISILTDPTTGGVTASFAMQGDIIVAEPHALIGFAGRRVIQDTIKQTLPDGFQTAEFALEHGLIDAIVERCDLRTYLAHCIALHMASMVVDTTTQGLMDSRAVYSYHTLNDRLNASVVVHPVAAWAAHSSAKNAQTTKVNSWTNRLKQFFGGASSSHDVAGVKVINAGNVFMKRVLAKRSVADTPGVKPVKKGGSADNPAWESVLLARNIHRPTAQYYIDQVVDGFIELHGDRAFADDGAIVAGIGWIAGCPVTVLAEEKGVNLQQRIARNFGCPQPEGYRKTLRLMKQAEKFNRPVVCLVDTQGAFCGMEAEERGQGNAIADNLIALAGLRVPVVCVVLGEGGSGGALALALGNRVAMQDHAVYSVLSPEGFASILWKDRSRAAEAAAVMKMSAAEAYEMGLIEEVLSEGAGPAHSNPEQAARVVKDFIVRSLRDLDGMSVEALVQDRYERFRAF